MDMFGKRARDLRGEEKAIFRSILIAFGCAWRIIDSLHWVKIVDKQIQWDLSMLPGTENCVNSYIPVIKDCRFINEFSYFESNSSYQASLVEVRRTDSTVIPPDEELRNQPALSAISQYRVEWPTLEPNELGKLDEYGERLLRQMEL